MAVRRRVVDPDIAVDTQTYGPIPAVSDQKFLEAVLAAAQVQSLAGGVLSVIVERHKTDMPDERVTTRALIEWKDRTDARPQPEPTVAQAPQQPAPVPEPHVDEPEPVSADDAERAAQINLDGLDPATLDEEDISAIDHPELVGH